MCICVFFEKKFLFLLYLFISIYIINYLKSFYFFSVIYLIKFAYKSENKQQKKYIYI